MAEIKHTPGPWTVNPLDADWESNTIFASTLANGTRRLVATVSVGSDAPANRRLIAAAPDLLEAARAAFQCIAELSPTRVRVEAAVMLTDAIAKATGA